MTENQQPIQSELAQEQAMQAIEHGKYAMEQSEHHTNVQALLQAQQEILLATTQLEKAEATVLHQQYQLLENIQELLQEAAAKLRQSYN
ncbi:MAG: hypothetical protein LRY73_05620 [Bacillus sp. (in: Bacteria)]|nr:hypothetical protein [Bacillus sp. (in: firmicutes)]